MADTDTPTRTDTGAIDPGEVLITCHDISFCYGQRPILSQVSVDVRAGEVVGLLGPNGTGKSTLLGVLAGDLRPASGTVSLCGRSLAEYDRRSLAQKRSVMPQSSDFPFSYLVHDIVYMGRSCWPRDTERDEQMVGRAIECTDVEHLVDRDVTQLSGGEKSRVTLARVIAQDAHVVFLDEPTAALDIAHQERTMELCTQLASKGCGVIAVMHDLQLAAAYCDRIAVMSAGKVVAFGPPSEVLSPDLLTEVYGWPIRVSEVDGEIVIIPERKGVRK
ncbi:heme ABC transporter ATP-binding protein [Trueperella sp. LYQ143]|uniref:heme ABC transporter ATP-binding protein n=1 Tax=unclassified Trueperella TaxID=2630174 RepID=UPI0039836313